MRWIVVSALLATAVVCTWIGMAVSRECDLQERMDNDTEQLLLAVVGAVALGLATGVAIRVHWLPRVIIVALALALAFGGIVFLEVGAWVSECD